MPVLFSKNERARIPNTLFKVKLQAMQLAALRKRNSLYAPFSGNLCVIKVIITTRHSQVVCKIDALKKLESLKVCRSLSCRALLKRHSNTFIL